MTVSSRGNAESVMAYLVLQTISLLQRRKIVLAAFLYALAVHVKIYPATYAPAVYLFLECEKGVLNQKTLKGSGMVLDFMWSLRPTWNRVKFVVVAGITTVLLTSLFYVR